jgi:hypothetical protein
MKMKALVCTAAALLVLASSTFAGAQTGISGEVVDAKTAGAKPFDQTPSYRWNLTAHGCHDWRFAPVSTVNARSSVTASFSELRVQDQTPAMGAASFDVHNIVPDNNGGVTVRFCIGWDSDLLGGMRFTVTNEPGP